MSLSAKKNNDEKFIIRILETNFVYLVFRLFYYGCNIGIYEI